MATQLIALEMLVVWTYLALHYVACAVRGTMHRHSGDPVQSFAIGTWVAGTAVVAELARGPRPTRRSSACRRGRRSLLPGDGAGHLTTPYAEEWGFCLVYSLGPMVSLTSASVWYVLSGCFSTVARTLSSLADDDFAMLVEGRGFWRNTTA